MRYIKLILFLVLGLHISLANAWTKTLNFDSGVPGTKAEGTADGFSGSAGGSVYSCEVGATVRLSGQCAKLQIKQGMTGFGVWGGIITFPSKLRRGDTVWFLVHTHMPVDFDHYSYGEGGRLKFLRIHTADANGVNLGYDDLYFDMKGAATSLRWIYEGEQKWVNVAGIPDYPVKGHWESYEMAVTLDSVPRASGGLAEVKIWKNGTLISHMTNNITLKDPLGYADAAYLFTYWNGGAPKDQFMYVDEVVVSSEATALDDAGNKFLGGLIKPTRPAPVKSELKAN